MKGNVQLIPKVDLFVCVCVGVLLFRFQAGLLAWSVSGGCFGDSENVVFSSQMLVSLIHRHILPSQAKHICHVCGQSRSQLLVFQWVCVCVSEHSAICICGKITDSLEMRWAV